MLSSQRLRRFIDTNMMAVRLVLLGMQDLREECAHGLFCPITHALLVEPVTIRGHLYERHYIEEHLIMNGRDIYNAQADCGQLRPCPEASKPFERLARQFNLRKRKINQ
jgi:hypothetical protein